MTFSKEEIEWLYEQETNQIRDIGGKPIVFDQDDDINDEDYYHKHYEED